MSGDVRSHRGCEKKRSVYNLADVTKPAEWNLLDEILGHFIRHTFAHADVDETRRDSVHRDVLARKLPRRNFRECNDGRFARRIIGLAK